MPNMIRIIQYFYYFHQLFVIKVVQIINLSIPMSLLQQALIFMRQNLIRCSNYLYLQMLKFIKKLIQPISDSYSFRTVNVYNNYWSYSQFDSIYLQYIFQDYGGILLYQCDLFQEFDNQIIQINDYDNNNLSKYRLKQSIYNPLVY
ncbi:unnamed protein product [Paramecium sonneborni]|uniref:Transmembrane protein n=1 Tax=Paramecium sonneborni TaxID=65129 RepID=A0A8S1RTG8_9CILI|nr:unnamed protein product [Paramecium sonneborni]